MLKNVSPPRKSLNHFNRQTYIIFNKQKLYIFVEYSPDFSNLSYTLPIILEQQKDKRISLSQIVFGTTRFRKHAVS